jgi:uncharacterized protein (DUF2235 family)
MKRIVLCFDGTWNKPADEAVPETMRVETNVRRFFESITATAADGVEQVAWYNEGVGTQWYDEGLGGAFGAGLDQHILDGYRFLVETHDDDDEVYVLGFSRGAYTARSLVGMIRNCGLVRPSFASWTVGAAYGIYRTRDDGPDSAVARAFREQFGREIVIRFLGVWDTVGALGIPDHFADKLKEVFYRFHDTALSRIVQNAYQAIALDEFREDYAICLWDPPEKPEQTVEQRWFVGAHSDVGGGYPDRRLSDLTLRWMQDRAAAVGLGLTPVTLGDDNFGGTLTDSYSQFLDGVYAKIHPRYVRPVLTTSFGGEILDSSIERRRRAGALAYQPTNLGLPPLVS